MRVLKKGIKKGGTKVSFVIPKLFKPHTGCYNLDLLGKGRQSFLLLPLILTAATVQYTKVVLLSIRNVHLT